MKKTFYVVRFFNLFQICNDIVVLNILKSFRRKVRVIKTDWKKSVKMINCDTFEHHFSHQTLAQNDSLRS